MIKYLKSAKEYYDVNAHVVCGYEAGCLGYSLYRELSAAGVECIILAPSTIPVEKGKKRIKTDKRDAMNIAKCLANNTYKPVHIPTEETEEIKEFIRMRNDHKLARIAAADIPEHPQRKRKHATYAERNQRGETEIRQPS